LKPMNSIGEAKNRIELEDVPPERCPVVEGEDRIMDSYADYLTDESRCDYRPVSAIYFPQSTAQVVDAVRRISGAGKRIVVSGSRTGIVGGATAREESSVITLERMSARVGDRLFQAGVKLDDVSFEKPEFYPVDPTETTASIGGTVATDASGARSYRYGSTRNYVRSLCVVLASGRVLRVARGDVFCEGGRFTLGHNSGDLDLPVRGIDSPGVKNVAGLFLRDDMDLVDLFVGSEGTLGIITEVGLSTVRLPGRRLFLVAAAAAEDEALELVDKVKSDDRLGCLAIEYFGPNAIELVRGGGYSGGLPEEASCAVYLEIYAGAEGTSGAVEEALTSCGLDVERTWADLGETDSKEMKRFRHAVPEAVNAVIAERKLDTPSLHKVGTDTAVPEGRLKRFLSFARSAIEKEGLEYVVFGHIGDNHLHVNMLPRNQDELEKAEELYRGIAEESVGLGGTVSAEHGIGRLKKGLLTIQFSEDDLRAMKAVKDALDPEGLLNPGVMF
jgi:D-lactate dehydrogenase (cytochrome)